MSQYGKYPPPPSTTMGTVTSVSLAAASIFTVSGSPITSSGTLTLGLAPEAAHTVFSGPSSGSAATPTFRLLVASDIPSLSGIYLPLAGGTMSGAIVYPAPSGGSATTINTTASGSLGDPTFLISTANTTGAPNIPNDIELAAGSSTDNSNFGGNILLNGGSGQGGGEFFFVGGVGDGQGGGGFIVECGNDATLGGGGPIDLNSGSSTLGAGGDVDINSGSGVTGGDFNFTAGNGSTGHGGNIILTGGNSTSGGAGGDIELLPGTGTGGGSVLLNMSESASEALIIKGAASQTGRFLDCKTNGGTSLVYIQPTSSAGNSATIAVRTDFDGAGYSFISPSGLVVPAMINDSSNYLGLGNLNNYNGVWVGSPTAFSVTGAGTIEVAATLNLNYSQTTLTGSAGTAICTQPFQGASYKKVIVYLNGYTDTSTQTFTYPKAFSHTPDVYGLSAGVSGATATNTSVTFTVTTATGFVFIEGF